MTAPDDLARTDVEAVERRARALWAERFNGDMRGYPWQAYNGPPSPFRSWAHEQAYLSRRDADLEFASQADAEAALAEARQIVIMLQAETRRDTDLRARIGTLGEDVARGLQYAMSETGVEPSVDYCREIANALLVYLAGLGTSHAPPNPGVYSERTDKRPPPASSRRHRPGRRERVVSTPIERVQIFTVDGSVNAFGQFFWGWRCFGCGDEETHWHNATTARDAADNHAALCRADSGPPAHNHTPHDGAT